MANEDFDVMNFPPSPPFLPTLSSVAPPSPPMCFPTSSNSMVVYPPPRSPSSSNSMIVYQGSGQSTMDNPLQNQQQQPLTPAAPPISRTNPYAGISQSVSMAAPTNSEESDMATEEYLIYWNSPSPSSNSMVVYYQGSGQSSMDHPLQNRQQRPANSGDQSDMAAEEHFDATSLLNLPQWSPPPSPSSASNSMLVYQRSGQSSMDFVERPPYIAGDWALSRQKLLQFWMYHDWGPRGGIMSINKKENLPQSLECLGINLLHLYVEDEFDTLLYWQGESSRGQLRVYMSHAELKVLPGMKFAGFYNCHDLEQKDYGQGMFVNKRVTMGAWRIGPREWVAKIRYQRHSLESPFYRGDFGGLRGILCSSEEGYQRTTQVLLEDARLNFPDLFQYFGNTVAAAGPHHLYPDEDVINYMPRTQPVIDGCVLSYVLYIPNSFSPTAYPYPDEDFVNGEVELVRIGGEGTEEAEIAESQLDPGPFRKKQRKEKTPIGERGNKETTRVKNVIPLDKILEAKEMPLKGAAEFLKVSRYALKRACRKHGINRWPPRNEHKTFAVVDQEGIPEPSENSCNDEVEAVGMGVVGTGKGEVKDGKLNCGSSDKGERNEKIPQGERANNKGTGVRIEIPLEEILKYKDMCRKDAATHLQVSISTLKRVCRGYRIYRWPPREEHRLIGQSRPNESPAIVDQERNPQKNSTTLLPSNEESASMDTDSVTIKARYEGDTFKLKLSKKPWGMAELEEQVKKRLQHETLIKYQDEDGDLISIVCDDDLQQCILSSRSQGTTSIVLLLEQKGSR